MLAMTKQLQMIPASDLRWISISCARCNAELTLDMTARLLPESDRDSLTPRACASCGAGYDSAVPSHVDAFRKVYAALSQVPGVAFRVEADQAG